MAKHVFIKTITPLMALMAPVAGDHTAVRHAAHVRGIEIESVHPVVQVWGDVHYAVVGEKNDDQGYDADGAPTMDYPGDTLPYDEKALPRLKV